MKKIIAGFFISMLILCPCAEAAEIPQWAYDAADKLIKNGMLSDKNMKREQLAKLLSENNKNVVGNKGESTTKIKSQAQIPSLKQDLEKEAPEWIYEPLTELKDAGLIGDDGDKIVKHNLTRREAAILTARAYNINKQNNSIIDLPENVYSDSFIKTKNDKQLDDDINKLMEEFDKELAAIGYKAGYAAFTKKSTQPIDKSIKVHGNIRYNIMNNSSNSSEYNWSDRRVRARIYIDKPLTENWTAHAMLQSDKSLSGDDNTYTKDKDGTIKLDRYYISGRTDLFGVPVNMEIGKTNAYLGDGNILDADFKGIKLSTFGNDRTDKSTLYSFGYGKVNDTEELFYFEMTRKTNKDYDYTIGGYHWNNYDNPTSIYSLGGNYYIGNYTLGAIYFKSDESDSSGASDGYALTAKYGHNRSWVPGTYEIGIHYYNMAGTTYIDPTMSGLEGYLDGFTGYGAATYYTLVPDVVLGLEYYDVKDKSSNTKVKTWWGEISYGF